jgi:hypothetical protein
MALNAPRESSDGRSCLSFSDDVLHRKGCLGVDVSQFLDKIAEAGQTLLVDQAEGGH